MCSLLLWYMHWKTRNQSAILSLAAEEHGRVFSTLATTLEDPGSESGHWNLLLERDFMVCTSLSMRMLGCYLKMVHKRFLPRYFLFIFHSLSHRPVLNYIAYPEKTSSNEPIWTWPQQYGFEKVYITSWYEPVDSFSHSLQEWKRSIEYTITDICQFRLNELCWF
jgi:hypothetical protein